MKKAMLAFLLAASACDQPCKTSKDCTSAGKTYCYMGYCSYACIENNTCGGGGGGGNLQPDLAQPVGDLAQHVSMPGSCGYLLINVNNDSINCNPPKLDGTINQSQDLINACEGEWDVRATAAGAQAVLNAYIQCMATYCLIGTQVPGHTDYLNPCADCNDALAACQAN